MLPRKIFMFVIVVTLIFGANTAYPWIETEKVIIYGCKSYSWYPPSDFEKIELKGINTIQSGLLVTNMKTYDQWWLSGTGRNIIVIEKGHREGLHFDNEHNWLNFTVQIKIYR